MKPPSIQPGSTYHIYNRGNNSQDTFFEDRNYRHFINRMVKYLTSIGEVYAFCLMRNHYHLIIKIHETAQLPLKYQSNPSQVISNWLNSYVKMINLTQNRTGSLFEKNFERKTIATNDYLKQAIIYVHQNPLKHRITKDFINYPYSSMEHYKKESTYLVSTGFVFELFGGKEEFWRRHAELDVNLPDSPVLGRPDSPKSS